MDTRYPEFRVRLSGEDGNAFFIITKVRKALRNHDVPPDVIEQYQNEAMSGDYDHLLQTTMLWVRVK